MDTPDVLVVSSVLRWVHDDMVAGTAGRWPVVWDQGRQVPEVPDGRAAWWAPTGHAAKLVAAGLDIPWRACPDGFLATLDSTLTGRRIEAGHAGELAVRWAGRSGFVKPSRAKLELLPAGVCTDVGGRLTAAIAAGLPADATVEATAEVLQLAVEHRTFVLDGQVTRPSPYLVGGQSWEPEFDGRTDVHTDDASRFAAEVAATLAAAGQVPRAYVLDVARTAAGGYVVLEANAAWSSGTYGCPLADVVDAVAVASLPGTDDDRWRWRPDVTEAAEAAARPLPDLRGR